MSGMIGSEPVLIRMVGAVTVMRSSPSPTATVCASTKRAVPVMTVAVSLPLSAVEVAGPEGAGQRADAGDGVGEELLRVVLEALRVGVVDEHLGRHAADVGAGAAVHVLGLLDEDDALARRRSARGRRSCRPCRSR